MAENFWNMKRASALIAHTIQFLDCDAAERQLSLFMPDHAAAGRGFNHNLKLLRQLQKERKQQKEPDLQEIGFVSQRPSEAPADLPQAPSPTQNPVVPSAETPRPPKRSRERLTDASQGRLKSSRSPDPGLGVPHITKP